MPPTPLYAQNKTNGSKIYAEKHRKQPCLTLASTLRQAGLSQPEYKLSLPGRLGSQWLHPVLGEDCRFLAGRGLENLLQQDRNTQQDTSNKAQFL